MLNEGPEVFEARRDGLVARLEEVVRSDPRLAGLWLQGSLAAGTADPLSDVDAYVAIEDAAFDAVYAEREALLAPLGGALVWADATTPGLRAVHALLEGPVKLDLYFEPLSGVERQARPAVRLLVDKAGLGPRLRTDWEPPVDAIGRALGVIVRMTRQGATWPVRVLHRGQWSTLAMMELDLINAQVAQLMAVQLDPGLYYTNPFAVHRALRPDQRAALDALTAAALDALARRDAAALREVHLRVYDALVREGRAACAALRTPYPVSDAADAALRAFLTRAWPTGAGAGERPGPSREV